MPARLDHSNLPRVTENGKHYIVLEFIPLFVSPEYGKIRCERPGRLSAWRAVLAGNAQAGGWQSVACSSVGICLSF